MSLPLLDRSNYYKGLLVLAGKDRIVDPRERELVIRVGGILDFDKRFCEAAIDDLLRNPHITDEPIMFPTREIAECFLRDGLRLAIVDEEIHPQELAWLQTIARVNGLTTEWLDAEAKRLREKEGSPDLSGPLAIQQYL
jgi:hypothetical protein